MRATSIAAHAAAAGQVSASPCGDSARISPPRATPLADGRLRPHGGQSHTVALSTTATSTTRGPMQGLLAALEHAWEAIRERHAEIPQVIMLVGTGSDHGGVLRKLGHFAARRWRLADGGERSEILVAGEGLDQGPEQVFATLLHEAAHALAFARGIRDTSKGGRYHNRRFAAIAAELGLQVGPLQPYGLAATTMPPATGDRHAAVLREVAGAMTLWRAAAPPRARRQSRRAGSSLVCLCSCPRRVRLELSIVVGPPVVCGGCGEPFLPQIPKVATGGR
jgi:hypothetical protein